MNHCHRLVAIWALALALVVGGSNSYAAVLVWTNTTDGYWADSLSWTNSTTGLNGVPGPSDDATITANGPYTVTITNETFANSIDFKDTVGQPVTLDLNGNKLSLYKSGTTQPTVFCVADPNTGTAVVYLVSSAGLGTLYCTNSVADTRFTVGRSGVGTLFVTNVQIVVRGSAILANGAGPLSMGTLVLSGPNTYWTNSSFFQIGNAAGSLFNSLVISNSASMTVGTTFAVGGAGSTSNSLLLDTSGQLFTGGGGTITVGNGAGNGNTATVRGGAFWNNGNRALTIGGTGTGNSLTIGAGGTVSNLPTCVIAAGNVLDLQGGLLQVSSVVSNFGTIQGFGTIVGNTIVTNVLIPANHLGQLTFSNDLILASTAKTTVKLGTNFNTTVVATNLTLDGTLNITNSGGLTNGTYTLFAYGGTLTTNGTPTILTIGTKPDTNGTYTVDISSNGLVNLDVTVPPPTAAFSANPTNGEAPSVAITFTNTSSGIFTNSSWNFGDATTTNTAAVSFNHTYATAGTYTVSLTVFGPSGSDTNTQSNYIVITNPPPPVAAFSGSPTTGAVPFAVTFTDTSTGNITNRFWNFGDSNTSNTTATSLSHTYSAAGTHTVSLIAFGYGGSNTNTQSGYIVGLNPANLVVTPSSRDLGSVTLGLTNSLSFSVINTGDASLSGTATSASPFSVTSGDSYNVSGGQTATVTVAFAPGSAATFTGSVIFASNGGVSTNAVTGIGLTPGSITVAPASHDFGLLVTGTTAQTTFVVTNTGGTAVSNGTATVSGPYTVVAGAAFNVSGFSSTNVTVQFAPVSAGAFTNNVVFATANGGDATNAVTGAGVLVPVAAFSGSPTTGAAPLPVTFTDSSTGNITNRFWDFGDGGTTNTTSTSVDYNYTAAGTSTVSLTVFGLGGSSTTNRPNYIIVTNVVVDTAPPALQIVSPTDYQTFTNAGITVSGTATDPSGLNGVTVNGSAASVVSTNWSKSVTLSSGTNTMTVIATDGSANLNTATLLFLAVFVPPTNNVPQIIAGLSVTNSLLQTGTVAVVLADETNTLTVAATDADSDPLSYQWVFGDGQSTNTSLGIVDHVYTNDCGPYNASVTVSDGQDSTNSDLTVAVACQLEISRLLAKVNFKKSGVDRCVLIAHIILPDGFDPAGKSLTMDIGGAEVVFALNAKRKAATSQGTCNLSFTKRTATWRVAVRIRRTNLQDAWLNEGLVDATIRKPGTPVTMRAVVLVGNEAFVADRTMLYRATEGKSGTAK